MSVDSGPDATVESKPSKKAKRIDAVTQAKIGEPVLYTPSITQANALRSVRGIREARFAAIVTYVRAEDGMCHLTVFPPFGLHSFTVQQVFEGEGPNTFARRD